MGDKTSIGWTDATWNFVRGCRRVSAGCQNCYAEQMATRFCGEGQPYEGLARRTESGKARWTGEGLFLPDKLEVPLRWTKPRKIFVNSMSDLFFEEFSFEQIAAAFAVMAFAKQHRFQVLTKRPERAREFFEWLETESNGAHPIVTCFEHLGSISAPAMNLIAARMGKIWQRPTWPLPNVWLGVSAENQATANARVPLLLLLPSAVRFVSAEPLLGPIDFRRLVHDQVCVVDAFTGEGGMPYPHEVVAPALDWIIFGGESGPGARPMRPDWVRQSIEDRDDSNTKIYVKQMGAVWARDSPDASGKGEDWTHWDEDLRVREYPA